MSVEGLVATNLRKIRWASRLRRGSGRDAAHRIFCDQSASLERVAHPDTLGIQLQAEPLTRSTDTGG